MTKAMWGIRFNEYPNYQRFHKGNKPEGCPEWLESHRISIWQEQGLIIWNNTDRKLESLPGTEALRLLHELNSQDTWKSDGVSVTRLVHQIKIDLPSRKKQLISQMAEQEKKRIQEALRQVWDIRKLPT